jgi:cytidylate kinase
MKRITLISGCPGAGKTTLSARMAGRFDRGAHFETDTFYNFPVNLIDPSLPGSNEQNTTIMRAISRAAAAFANGGYEVFVEGILGPWFFPVLLKELSGFEVSYIVLRISAEVSLKRVAVRDGDGREERVIRTCRAFDDLGIHERHVIESPDMDAETLFHAAFSGWEMRKFVLLESA